MPIERTDNTDLNDIYAGKNPIREALKAGIALDSVYVTAKGGPLSPLIAECEQAGAVVKVVHPAKLDAMAGGANHQGIVALGSCIKPATLDDIFNAAAEKGEKPLILIADEIEDPHNLGALIRSAECAGAHGVITCKHRSAALSGVVSKSSAGAAAYLPVVRVTNLVNTIKELQQRGVWVYGADMGGKPYDELDFRGSTALVIGSEGNGLGRLVSQTCDDRISIPMCGRVNSLNASVAGGILLFEAAAQRRRAR